MITIFVFFLTPDQCGIVQFLIERFSLSNPCIVIHSGGVLQRLAVLIYLLEVDDGKKLI